MNNIEKMEKILDDYIKIMKNLNEETREKVEQTVGVDLKNISTVFNKNSTVKVRSIKASRGSIVSFGVMTSLLITTCKERKRDDIIKIYNAELDRMFKVFSTDKRYVNLNFINEIIEKNGSINIEYPEIITNIFLNTGSALACRILLAQYGNETVEGNKHIEKYLYDNYFKEIDIKDTRHMIIA